MALWARSLTFLLEGSELPWQQGLLKAYRELLERGEGNITNILDRGKQRHRLLRAPMIQDAPELACQDQLRRTGLIL